MEFVKMHGLGNDFIILDDTDNRQKNGREGFGTEKHCCEENELSPELVRHFCDRAPRHRSRRCYPCVQCGTSTGRFSDETVQCGWKPGKNVRQWHPLSGKICV